VKKSGEGEGDVRDRTPSNLGKKVVAGQARGKVSKGGETSWAWRGWDRKKDPARGTEGRGGPENGHHQGEGGIRRKRKRGGERHLRQEMYQERRGRIGGGEGGRETQGSFR